MQTIIRLKSPGAYHCPVAPATAKFISDQDMATGLCIDMLVRKETGKLEAECPRETSELGLEAEAGDAILECARGLLALIYDRGTAHLSQEQIAQLDDNFTLLTNNFLASFRKKATK